MGRKRASMVLAAMLLLSGASVPVAMAAAREGANWSSYGGDTSENHYSPLNQINDKTIGRLKLAWSYDLPVTPNGLASPLAIDGTLYFPVGHSVIHAMDAVTGKLLWQYDPNVYEVAGHKMRAGWGNRGLAYWQGVIYSGTLDGRLIALDAKTGKLLWSTMTVEPDDARYITGAPWIADGKVIIGHGGADYGPVRGYVTAYDAKTGKQAWRFYTVPGNPADGFENKAMEMAAKTWNGEWWKLGGGGTVWHAMAYDKKYNRILIGTGNGAPWNQKIRSPGGGDNLFLCSIIALDAKTGEYVWHYQVNPGETWDFNAAMDIELTELKIDGKKRDVILHAPKNGFFYVIDRKDGKLISAEKFVKNVNWAEKIDVASGRPVENPDARFPDGKAFLTYPSSWGAHGVAAMSFNRKTGLTYIPTTDIGVVYADPASLKDWKFRDGMAVNSGLGPAPAGMKAPPGSSSLLAWDPVAQKPAWEVPLVGMQNGGTLTTAGNLVFQPQVTGELSAYAADTGKKLWAYDLQVGTAAKPVTYWAGGKQYMTILTGWRGTGASGLPTEWNYYTQKRRVLTFTLDGAARLPPVAQESEAPILDKADFVVDDKKAALGMAVFHRNCHVCHGPRLIAGGAAPDLRRGQMPLEFDSLKAVLHDGALKQNGMPAFEEMPDTEIEALQHYIRQQSRAALAAAK
ncbi:PQQ-dependent dehydrogenase, methanol/ethanol family [Niveispirillum sp.]|uniref:PQQ-dependent dehydrogenase, methanol/ethanol family n=1 Tax=Niveispirillum sp. TaxID=1917217 RepID=UPI001B70DB5A|nr:PQQ-dependent dehydrogenase, methanol/ethanol family [Niveispirillum sp.]MBP7336298.1 PQQ-dependent dehydrogenase, methanol/ethanol family [Niveispirillum sp.]